MQHRTPSPNTQSGASVKFRGVMLVLLEHFLPFSYARVSRQHDPKNAHRLATAENHRGTGFGGRGNALGVLEKRQLGASVCAFVGNVAVPRAHTHQERGFYAGRFIAAPELRAMRFKK